jgi:large subunit ribosomal protein L15
MQLHDLKPAEGSTKVRKRLGRGTGSGMGGTSTRGHKGAKSRSGYSRKVGFEGGQMPLYRRLPKLGFKHIKKVTFYVINLDILQSLSEEYSTSTVDVAFLQLHGLASGKDKVKILGRGELNASMEVHAHAFSASATEAIEKAGGKAVIL